MNLNTSQTIIFDNGSGIIKAGVASDRIPKCIIQNQVSRLKTGDPRAEILIGAQDDLSKLSVTCPVEHGVVTNWDDMERVWHHIYHKQLNLLSEEHPVIFAEPALNPIDNREKIVEIFFEKFNVPAMDISMETILTLYSTGRTTGVILDSGDGVTSAVPICEGFALPEYINRIDFAGREVTQYLRMLLKKEGIDFPTSADFDIVRRIKENMCYMSENPLSEENNTKDAALFKLPDGKEIEIGPSRFRAGEVLFRPDFLGRECDGLHQILCKSIMDSDLNLRSTLFRNIILSGGSTLFKGFGSRLLSALKEISPKYAPLKISAPKERLYSVWIGGSILASLNNFQKTLITKQTYEEKGKELFHRRLGHISADYYYALLNK